MAWSIHIALKCLRRRALVKLAEKCNLSSTGNTGEIRSQIASYYSRKPKVFRSYLRKRDILTIIRCYSDRNDMYLPGAVDFSKANLLRIFKSVILSVESPEQFGFCKSEPEREYQVDAVGQLLIALDCQSKPVCLQLATGGGKTRIANDLVAKWQLSEGGPIIWISKDWRLLDQAAFDANQRLCSVRIRRLGGEGKLPIKKLKAGANYKGILYTTLHTLHRRREKISDYLMNASLLVWDECHWGQNSKMGRWILKFCNRFSIPILGLTATPHESDTYHIAYSRTFFDLVNDGWLAKPIIEEPVATGMGWSPSLDRFGDFDRKSLADLGSNKQRNHLIAAHYDTYSSKYKQTLVFACNIKHADNLVKAFMQFGVAVAPIHSEVPDDKRNMFLQDFRNGSIRVLITVEMLTHGVDLPSVTSVFLCRPTTSDILFAQMIGRGARIHENKAAFHIVEFTDNVKKHFDLIVTPKIYFRGAGNPNQIIGTSEQQPERRVRHGFDPGGLPTWIQDDESLPSSIRGLWLMRSQTFGIEFELTHPGMPDIVPTDPKWAEVAVELLKAIRTATIYTAEEPIYGYAGTESNVKKDCSLWNVEYDSTAGLEITSRILCDIEGYLEVDSVCMALEEVTARLGLVVNHKTATHIHLGWNKRTLEELRRIVRLVRIAEPALGTLVAPSRLSHFDGDIYNLNKPNMWSQTINVNASEQSIKSWKSWEDVIEAFDDRCITFNPSPLLEHGTVEVRMHSGTIEARKILLWTSLWQQMLWASSVEREVPATTNRKMIIPNGDIIKFARRWLPNANEPAQAALLRRLDSRREEILEVWRHNTKLREWVEFSQHWQRAT